MCVSAKLLQLCPTLCSSMDCGPPGSSVHGILQARTLEWVAMSSSRGSSQSRDQTWVSISPALAGRFFTTSVTGEAQYTHTRTRIHIHVVVQSLSLVLLFATPRTAARQASLSSTISRSLLKLISTESVMPSNHLFLCYPLLLLPSIFPSIRVFSNESALCIRWPKCWSFNLSISPSNE